MILLSNSVMIFLQFSLFEEKLGELPTKKVCSYVLTDVLTPPIGSMINRYEDLFDNFIPDNVEEHHMWKPLIAKPLNLSSKINPLMINNQCSVIQCEAVNEKYILLVNQIC